MTCCVFDLAFELSPQIACAHLTGTTLALDCRFQTFCPKVSLVLRRRIALLSAARLLGFPFPLSSAPAALGLRSQLCYTIKLPKRRMDVPGYAIMLVVGRQTPAWASPPPPGQSTCSKCPPSADCASQCAPGAWSVRTPFQPQSLNNGLNFQSRTPGSPRRVQPTANLERAVARGDTVVLLFLSAR